jgi:hypothetical protein
VIGSCVILLRGFGAEHLELNSEFNNVACVTTGVAMLPVGE